jgi:hypothetical protein
MPDLCNEGTVAGWLLGMREANGHTVDISDLNPKNQGEVNTFNKVSNSLNEAVLEDAPDSPSKGAAQQALSFLTGDGKQVGASIISDLRNPSGLFGEEKIAPVVDYITNHYQEHFGDIKEGREDYFDGIRDVFDSIDTSDLSVAQEKAWNKYRSFYQNGGELYTLNTRSGLEKGISNLMGNVIKSSPTVIIGNLLEGTIKLPTLYPKTFLQGIAEAQRNGGVLKEIPELAQQGVYGVNYAGEAKSPWEGLIGLTDVPLKNIAYYADKLAGGDGLKGVQKVAFTPRFGDLPSVYYSSGGRAATQFLNYTINTYKMYGSLWQSAKQGNVAPLVTYHLLAGLLGGGTAAIPMVAQNAITSLIPESEEWFAQNSNVLTQLIQPGNINRLGVGYDIANRQIKSAGSNWESAFDRFQDGDTVGGVLDLADLGLNALTFTSSPLGDLNIQKGLRIGKEVMQKELDLDEVPGELQEKYLPFTMER